MYSIAPTEKAMSKYVYSVAEATSKLIPIPIKTVDETMKLLISARFVE